MPQLLAVLRFCISTTPAGAPPYLVVPLVRGIEDAKQSAALTAEPSRMIVDDLSRTLP